MKKILFILACVLVTFSVMAQSGVNLRLNLEKNKVYRLSSISEQQISQTINGNQQNTESKSRYVISLKMMDVTPDFMIVEARFDTMITNTNTMGKISVMSSAKEGDVKSAETAEVMSYFMNKFVKNPLFLKMDFTGKVLEFLNIKMFAEATLKDTSAITLTGPVASAVKMSIVNMVSDKSLSNLVEMFTYNLPGKQVETGGKWNITQKMYSGGMTLDIINDFRLDEVNGFQAKISSESNIKAAENAPPIESAGARVTYDDLTGLSKSNLIIDIRTGLLIENKAKTHISGNMGVSVGAMSMTIPMDINGESKINELQ